MDSESSKNHWRAMMPVSRLVQTMLRCLLVEENDDFATHTELGQPWDRIEQCGTITLILDGLRKVPYYKQDAVLSKFKKIEASCLYLNKYILNKFHLHTGKTAACWFILDVESLLKSELWLTALEWLTFHSLIWILTLNKKLGKKVDTRFWKQRMDN